MSNTEQHYFDVLPLHKQPERFESFTSYLMRLTESNSFKSVSQLASLCAFGWGPYKLKDHPPLSFGTLQTAAVCSTDSLLSTTFYYLVKRFGRSSLPQASARFLLESITQNLRYCPKCLSLRSYYSLVWRFFRVSGCSEHQCFLLDRCGHCGRLVPIFTNSGKVGMCPTCDGLLNTCTATQMSDEECGQISSIVRELEFLLSPVKCEVEGETLAKRIGLAFARRRQAKPLAIREAALQLGTTVASIEAIEYGRLAGSFERYIQYADFLGSTLEAIFLDVDMSSFQDQGKSVKMVPPSEETVVGHVQGALMQLKANGLPPTQAAICELIRMSQPQLIKYPKAVELVRQATVDVRNFHAERKKAQSEEVYVQMQKAIKQLTELEQPLTEKNIRSIMGISKGQLSRLKRFPPIQLLLEDSIKSYHANHKEKIQLQECALKLEVEAAIELLKANEQRLTRAAISRIVAVPVPKLKTYAQVKDVLMQHVPTTRQEQFQEEELIEQIEDAVRKLTDNGQIVTQRTVAKLVGISASGIKNYPRAKALIDRHASWYHYYTRRQLSTLGDELLVKVEDAIGQLQKDGQPLTQYSIGSVLEISPYILKGYLQVRRVLEQFEEGYREHRTERVLQREEVLLEKIKAAVTHLMSRGETMTIAAVGRVVEISESTMNYYPSVRAFLKSVMSDEDKRRISRGQMREDFLVLEVVEAIEYLKQHGQPISVRSIARIVGSSPSELKSYPRTKLILDQVVPKSRKRTSIDKSLMPDSSSTFV